MSENTKKLNVSKFTNKLLDKFGITTALVAMLAKADQLQHSRGNMPIMGKGRDSTWRGSRRARSLSARSNRRKAARKARRGTA